MMDELDLIADEAGADWGKGSPPPVFPLPFLFFFLDLLSSFLPSSSSLLLLLSSPPPLLLSFSQFISLADEPTKRTTIAAVKPANARPTVNNNLNLRNSASKSPPGAINSGQVRNTANNNPNSPNPSDLNRMTTSVNSLLTELDEIEKAFGSTDTYGAPTGASTPAPSSDLGGVATKGTPGSPSHISFYPPFRLF